MAEDARAATSRTEEGRPPLTMEGMLAQMRAVVEAQTRAIEAGVGWSAYAWEADVQERMTAAEWNVHVDAVLAEWAAR